jgi:EmrB/QacA subfamily drug resistance transporter
MATAAFASPIAPGRVRPAEGTDAYMWQALAVIAMGSFMVVLDTTIVNIALPRIITVFGSTVEQSQLVLTGYMMALAIIMPCTQYLSQTFGTKRLFIVTLALFTIGSALCGAAVNMPTLAVARVLQGLGGGMIQPLGMGLLFQITPAHRRGAVMGIFALPVMVAPIMGPTLGGYLTEYVSWRSVFYLNVPIGILACIMAFTLLRESPTRPGLRFDVVGFVLVALSTAPALLALEDVPSKGFGDLFVLARLVVSVTALPVFVWWELRTREPLLNVRLFAIGAFSMGALISFVTTTALFGALFLLPVFLQNLRGLGAMETGLLLFPQALASTVSVVLGGRLYDKVGARPLIVVGLAVLGFSTWLLSSLDVTTPDSTVRWILVLRGFSIGFAMMPAMTAWQAAAPRDQSQAASALQNVIRQVYSAFATAMFATLLQSRIKFHTWSLTTATTPDTPAVAQLIGQMKQYALAHGLTAAQGQGMAVAQIYGQILRKASVMSFDDCFLVAAAACRLGIVPALFLRSAQPAGGGHGPVEV